MFTPPLSITADVFATLPDAHRRTTRTEWGDVQKQGALLGSFLEGPCFDTAGDLHVTDIPHGRIFRVPENGRFEEVAHYDGEPNGLAFHPDGRAFIADHKNGIMALDPSTGRVEAVLRRARLEPFRGVNDLTFASNGDLWFTDQGQSGLQDPNGRVFRYSANGDLTCFLSRIPSPNGLLLDIEQRNLLLAVTRANQVWRAPILADGGTSKVAAMINLSGGFGPDGMALDSQGGFFVCQPGLGRVYWFDAYGEIQGEIRSPTGRVTTNCAFGAKDPSTLYITEAESETILRCKLPVPGHPLLHQAYCQ